MVADDEPVTHAVTLNGRATGELRGFNEPSREGELIRRLRLLDGHKIFSLILWRLPPCAQGGELDLGYDADEYIQCAGDFRGRMTVEVRDIVAGTPRQLVLGRASSEADPVRDEVVPWNGCETPVAAHEVLSGDEVVELCVAYLCDGNVPVRCSRRPITL